MENSFRSLVDASSSILILLPTKPYFDQVAAGLGLYLELNREKEVNIVCPEVMLVEFNRLVGVDKITTELGNKNLVVKFKDYEATNIERVGWDIENKEFRLTIVPKPGVAAPVKNQINLTYSGVSADLVILIGGGNESHFPALLSKDLLGVKTLHIGIRPLSVNPNREVISFARPSSSNSELVNSLVKESGYDIDSDIATNLLLGIEAGSNNFSSQGVTADTFQTVADLLRVGARRHEEKLSRSNFPPGAIPGDILPVKTEEVENKEAPKDWLTPKSLKEQVLVRKCR